VCDLFLSERPTVELRAVSGRLRAASGWLRAAFSRTDNTKYDNVEACEVAYRLIRLRQRRHRRGGQRLGTED